METSAVQAIKLAIVGLTGLSRDALHIHVGLGTYFLAHVLFRGTAWHSTRALLAVAAVACAGELLDLRDDLRTFGVWRWSASLHDVVNTAFWPLVLFAAARWRGQPRGKS